MRYQFAEIVDTTDDMFILNFQHLTPLMIAGKKLVLGSRVKRIGRIYQVDLGGGLKTVQSST